MEELLKRENKISRVQIHPDWVDRVSETEIESLTQDMMNTITIFKEDFDIEIPTEIAIKHCLYALDIYWHKKTKAE